MTWPNSSALERGLHAVASASRDLQIDLAAVEDRVFAPALAGLGCERPIFVTSLPRAGTTLLLNILSACPGLASHTYRDMPFLLCPLFWNRVSRGFHREGTARERMHGDGMLVDVDSVEAFEDILWRQFWPDKYRAEGITPWTNEDRDIAFETFFRNHMRKIILLRHGSGGRYLSKCNGNVLRLPLLRRIFPDSLLIVPFRNPGDHAASLLRQHRNFLDIHARDAFTRRYMKSIGHLEFGANFSPMLFPHVPAPAPDTLSYWVSLWSAAFSHLLSQEDTDIQFFDYDRFCREPEAAIGRLAAMVQVSRETLAQAAPQLRPARAYNLDTFGVLEPGVMARAETIHSSLLARATF
jgi:hypothetical protein